MRKISANYIHTGTKLLNDGVVVIDEDGKVLLVDERKNFSSDELEIYDGIICPGFINAHCHLELSYLKGEISEHTGFVCFISDFLKKRNDGQPEVQAAIEQADKEMWQQGIVGIGDISNAVTSLRVKS